MKTILFQFDTDLHPSTFDRVVAVDAGVDEIFSYGNVSSKNVVSLVHGGMFTRGPADLKNTAIFIGGSDVTVGETLMNRIKSTLFPPLNVSVMMDSNGSNTTAAAAVLSAGKHLDLSNTAALVLGGTGPVGQRAAQLLVMQGAQVRVGSRTLDRATEVCERIRKTATDSRLTPCETSSQETLEKAGEGVLLIISAGAAGVEFLSEEQRTAIDSLKVAIDLNAVPPLGLSGLEVTDKATERDGVICYGAIGVGGLKMRIHKAALRKLFEANDRMLGTEAIYRIGEELIAD